MTKNVAGVEDHGDAHFYGDGAKAARLESEDICGGAVLLKLKAGHLRYPYNGDMALFNICKSDVPPLIALKVFQLLQCIIPEI